MMKRRRRSPRSRPSAAPDRRQESRAARAPPRYSRRRPQAEQCGRHNRGYPLHRVRRVCRRAAHRATRQRAAGPARMFGSGRTVPTALSAWCATPRRPHRIDAVADDLRPDEDDQLGALRATCSGARTASPTRRELIEQRNAAARCLFCVLADQAGEQHGLAARRPRSSSSPGAANRRRQRCRRCWRRDVADLLLDVEHDVAVGVDARHARAG